MAMEVEHLDERHDTSNSPGEFKSIGGWFAIPILLYSGSHGVLRRCRFHHRDMRKTFQHFQGVTPPHHPADLSGKKEQIPGDSLG